MQGGTTEHLEVCREALPNIWGVSRDVYTYYQTFRGMQGGTFEHLEVCREVLPNIWGYAGWYYQTFAGMHYAGRYYQIISSLVQLPLKVSIFEVHLRIFI